MKIEHYFSAAIVLLLAIDVYLTYQLYQAERTRA